MQEGKYKSFLIAARQMPQLNNDYSKGYQKGLNRFYHGEKFGTQEEHENLLSLDKNRQELGDGYRDGFAGKPPRGFHGNIGNKNAMLNDLLMDSDIKFRINSQVKSKFVKKAQSENLKLSAWIMKNLLQACKE